MTVKLIRCAMFAMVGFATLLPSTTLAQTTTSPSKNSVIKLIKVSDMDKVQDGALFGFVGSLTQAMQKHPLIATLPDHKKPQAQAIIDDINAKLHKDLTQVDLSKEFNDGLVSVTQKYYTQQEVDALIAFYSTPIGKSIVKKQLPMMQELTNQTMNILQNPQFEQIAQKSIYKYMTEFEMRLEELAK